MDSETAKPLMPHEPFIVIRMVPGAVLKYQSDKTASSAPEGVTINALLLSGGVAVREELRTTGINTSFIG